MSPLSIWTYYRRHKRHAALLLGLSVAVAFAAYSLVALVWGAYVEPARQAYRSYTRFSMVTPASSDEELDPALLAELRANPDVAGLMPATVIRLELPGLVGGQGFQFDLLGLLEADVPALLERFGAVLERGQVPEPGTNQMLLSEDLARLLDLELGDVYEVTSVEFYVGMDSAPDATPFQVSGILDSPVKLGIVSLEYLEAHPQYRLFPARWLVFAEEGSKADVDRFLRAEIQDPRTSVMTLEMLEERIVNEALPGLALLLPVILLVAAAFALVIVVVNQMANAGRLPEFGILHATGRSRRWLVRRLTAETAVVAVVGWVAGVGLAWLALSLPEASLFAARGLNLDYVAWVPIALSAPIPATIALVTRASVRRTFRRLDPVAIVERGILSLEGSGQGRRAAAGSSSKPLSPATFYRRHRRRAVLLVSGMGLMVMAIVLFAVVLSVGAGAKEPFLGYLRRVSVVQDLDPGAVARLESHPAVERVIPVAPRSHMLSVTIPPFNSAEASPFGVYAGDMAYLVGLYGLELEAGHLPRPGSNEMAISRAVALNRDIQVGDIIGARDRPAYPGAPTLPVEFVVSGILAQPAGTQDGSALGFISLEFLESEEPFLLPGVLPRLVVPKPGQKEALDAWLEAELASNQVPVLTYAQQIARLRGQVRQDLTGMALLQSVIAVVAALGLAVLNTVFVSQRRTEFGVLNALGFSRRQLVARVLRETAYATGIAWGVSAVSILLAMLCLRYGVFAPRGLSFDLFTAAPWIQSLPIPAAVLAATAGTTARTLSTVDAVAIIERR